MESSAILTPIRKQASCLACGEASDEIPRNYLCDYERCLTEYQPTRAEVALGPLQTLL
jgi:hypothetical protein